MNNFYDSRSNDFQTAMDNYKNNINSVAQGQISSNMDQLTGAKEMMLDKANILAGGEESSISDKIQKGMSKTMDELGLDMSVKTIGEKALPWVAKKLTGKAKSMAAERDEARRTGGSQESTIETSAADDAQREQYLNRMGRGNAQDEQVARPARQPQADEPPPGSGQAQDIDAVTGQPINRSRPQEESTDDPAPIVRDDDGNELEDEDTRVSRIRAQNEADDAEAGGRDYYTGSARPLGSTQVESSGPDLTGAAARPTQPTVDEPPPAATEAPTSSFSDQIAQAAGERATVGADAEDVLRGGFGPETQAVLRGEVANVRNINASGGGARASSRPDADVDNIPAGRPPPARAAEPPETSMSRGDTLSGRITQQQQAPSQIDPEAEQRQIASERESGQYDRPAGGEEEQGQSSFEELQEQMRQTEGSAEANISRETGNMERTLGTEESEEGGIGLSDVLGGLGRGLGLLGDVLGPAAAIFGGIEAARGIAKDAGDADPYAKVKGMIATATQQQAGMNAEISADSFASMVGAGKPSFGSLAAPTMDSSMLMGGGMGHF